MSNLKAAIDHYDLQEALDRYAANQGMLTHELDTIVKAARRILTPDYEAAQKRMDALLGYFNPDVSIGEVHIEADPIIYAALGMKRGKRDKQDQHCRPV